MAGAGSECTTVAAALKLEQDCKHLIQELSY